MPNSPPVEQEERLSVSHGVRRAGSSNEEPTEKRLMMSGVQGTGLMQPYRCLDITIFEILRILLTPPFLSQD